MENEEMLEQTNETENAETQTAEENVEGIELTDTTNDKEDSTNESAESEEKEEVKKTLRDILEENEDYQKEFNTMIQTRLDRVERKHQKELSKFRDTEQVLRTTLKLNEGDDTNAKLREYYESEGIKLPEPIQEGLSQREIERLGLGDADDIIAEGYDAVEEEANRLAGIGYKNLNDREKVTFNKLAETLTAKKETDELLKLGAKKELLTNPEFIGFRSQFNSNVPIDKVYGMYMKEHTEKAVKENPGSMKNNDVNVTKDYYTPEEIASLSEEQLDDPKIWAAVRKSMTKNTPTNYYE